MITVSINGEKRTFEQSMSAEALLKALSLDPRKVAVERNREIIARSRFSDAIISDGDQLEIVHFVGGGDKAADDDSLVIAGKRYSSRLIVGTGKYRDFDETARAVAEAGSEIVTVAVRRVNVMDKDQPMLTDYLDPKSITYLPNTAGCYTAEDALRTLRLAREAGGWDLVKLEVLGDKTTLYPDMRETIKAASVLIDEGFKVMVYTSDDPLFARELEQMGCVAIMPLGAPIGSGLGIQNPINIRLIVEQSQVPVIVDAGVGTASDATIAMELGCDAVLMNTAIAEAKNPIMMARAMRHAVIAGRSAYCAGRMPKKRYADPSSPLAGLI